MTARAAIGRLIVAGVNLAKAGVAVEIEADGVKITIRPDEKPETVDEKRRPVL
jgi:hypothetical protein